MGRGDVRSGGHRLRRIVLAVGVVLAGVAVGAVIGAIAGLATPAHVELAGSDTRVWLEVGHTTDRVGVTGVVSLERPTTREVLGEPVAVRAVLDIDASMFVTPQGRVNSDLLPAYIQAYSDPDQLVADIRHALIVHLMVFVLTGAAVGLLAAGASVAYRRWRLSYDRAHFSDDRARRVARAYRRPERTWGYRAAGVLVAAALLAAVPSPNRHPRAHDRIPANPVLADTPLAGIAVGGLLRPALVAARNYIETYFRQTDEYYDDLRDALKAELDDSPVELPGGDDVAQVGFVTDRHCNTGMDRVVLTLLKRFGVHTLVSAGDDDFSGTFAFESACTRTLAQQSAKAGIADVFAAGNHDSPQTISDEQDQGITTLTGDVVTVNGLRFIGSPDPRTSRYGEGIRPASDEAQHVVTDAQGRRIGETACTADGPVIAVLHDPRAGMRSIENGCGNVTVALDGHTHRQAGPRDIRTAAGTSGTQFTGGSAGGAPGSEAVDSSLASQLTVGPLRHDAFVYLAGIDRDTGQLVAITTFRFTPARQVDITQTYVL